MSNAFRTNSHLQGTPILTYAARPCLAKASYGGHPCLQDTPFGEFALAIGAIMKSLRRHQYHATLAANLLAAWVFTMVVTSMSEGIVVHGCPDVSCPVAIQVWRRLSFRTM